jgi:hypothetical protein
MHFPRKRWRLGLTAVLAALAVSVTLASPAHAAEQGEWNNWTPETINNGAQQLTAQGSISEARNGADLLQVWRAADTTLPGANQVWASYNHGPAFSIGGSSTQTYASPQAVAAGDGYFYVFHTGTDGNIYYTGVYGNNNYSHTWAQVPGQTTPNNMPVSVTQMGPNSNQLYMVYHSASNDAVWGTRYDGANWVNTENIDGGTSPSAPSVTYNTTQNRVYVAAQGEDNQVWTIGGYLYQSYMVWFDWTAQGGGTVGTPSVAATSDGTMLVDYRAADDRIWYRLFNSGMSALGDWSQDTTFWQTLSVAILVAVGNRVYAIITGEDNNNVYYKQAFNPT